MNDCPDDLRREDAKRAHDAEREFWKLNNEAAINSGILAVRTAFLVNGGAAVAMLTFIGGMVAQGKIDDADLHGLASNLMWFAFGVALAAVATAFAYFVNLATAEGSASKERIWESPIFRDTGFALGHNPLGVLGPCGLGSVGVTLCFCVGYA